MKILLLFITICISSVSFGQIVNIPDPNFKACLVGNTLINTNGDTEIQVSEANSYTGEIWCTNMSITDFTGIEAFNLITGLSCSQNQLTSLDVSNSTSLFFLYCQSNELTSLNLPNSISLEWLECGDNLLTTLDVTNNPSLTELLSNNNQIAFIDLSNNNSLQMLFLSNNQLTDLDLTNVDSLISFRCDSNQITTLDLTNNSVLKYLECNENNLLQCINVKNGNNNNILTFNVQNNPNLTCVEVDVVAYSTVNWTNIDPQTYFSANCNNACSVGLEELSSNNKELIKIVNLLGQEVEYTPNTVLIYQYSDGTSEKVFSIED